MKYSYKEMQENLPDYVFGRLTDNEMKIFETTLSQYPDLTKEIEDIKKVFGKVEAIDFNSMLEQRTKNLSVKVQNRLQSSRSGKSRFGYFIRLAVPTIGMAAIVVYLFVSGLKEMKNQNGTDKNLADRMQILKPSDMSIILDDNITSDDYLNLADKLTQSYDYTNIICVGNTKTGNLDEMYYNSALDYIFSDNNKINIRVINFMQTDESIMGEELKNLSKEDFDKIIEDIKNADILS